MGSNGDSLYSESEYILSDFFLSSLVLYYLAEMAMIVSLSDLYRGMGSGRPGSVKAHIICPDDITYFIKDWVP